MLYPVCAVVNGREVRVHVPVEMTLVDMLRDTLGLMGTKVGCRQGECGACTVLFDGRTVNACLVLAVAADGHEVVTIEGVSSDRGLDPIQQAFVNSGAVQCGYCTPGMVLAAKSLLDSDQNPTRKAIRVALSGNLCRCTGYTAIVEAVECAASHIAENARNETAARP